MAAGLDLVFWPGSVRVHPYEDQITAARAGGFTSFAMPPDYYQITLASGMSHDRIVGLAVDAGVPIRHFDCLTDWAPVRAPYWAEPPIRDRYDVTMDDALRLCESLAVETILAFPGFDITEAAPIEVLAEGFGRLCDRAADLGMRVQLEFAPMLGLPNLSDAWDVVRTADRPNSGVLVDTHHFFRGDYDLDLLRTIPGDKLWGVQVADGTLERFDGGPFDDAGWHRAFPGEGALPLQEILGILQVKGGLTQAGPETFSAVADELGPIEAGKRDGDGLRTVLNAAGIRY